MTKKGMSGDAMKSKTAAVLTIKAPGKMTRRGRRSIAAWLRRHARYMDRRAHNIFTKGNFTARYIYS